MNAAVGVSATVGVARNASQVSEMTNCFVRTVAMATLGPRPCYVPGVDDSPPENRQPSSALCFVCGTDNPHGLGATFYDDGKRVWTEVTPGEHHQSWPGVLHGGVITAILDETIGRVAFLHDRWVQTAKLSIRFTRPAPLGEALLARGELVRNHRRLMEMHGNLYLAGSGELLAKAEGTFMPLPDAARDELAKRLGGDFEAWEKWLSSNRSQIEI